MIDICWGAHCSKCCANKHPRSFHERPGKTRGNIPARHEYMFEKHTMKLLYERSFWLIFNIYNSNCESGFYESGSFTQDSGIHTYYTMDMHTYLDGRRNCGSSFLFY